MVGIYGILAIFPAVFCIAATTFSIGHERRMFRLLLSVSVAISFLCLILKMATSELDGIDDVLMLSSANVFLYVFAWVTAKKNSAKAKTEQNPFSYLPVRLGIAFIVGACFAVSIFQLVLSFIFGSSGIFLIIFGLRFWAAEKG